MTFSIFGYFSISSKKPLFSRKNVIFNNFWLFFNFFQKTFISAKSVIFNTFLEKWHIFHFPYCFYYLFSLLTFSIFGDFSKNLYFLEKCHFLALFHENDIFFISYMFLLLFSKKCHFFSPPWRGSGGQLTNLNFKILDFANKTQVSVTSWMCFVNKREGLEPEL